MLGYPGRTGTEPIRGDDVNTTWQRYLDLANGLGQVTQRGAEVVVKALVKQGEIAADFAERAVDDLLARSEANRQAVRTMVEAEMDRAIARLGLVRREEVDRLRSRIEGLESSRTETRRPAADTAPES